MSSPIASVQKDLDEAKLDLVVEALHCCGRVQLRVWGMSMLPSLWPGDLVTLQTTTPEEIIPGDIGLVLGNKRFFIHRVVAKKGSQNGLSFITRGDALPDDDPSIAQSKLLAKVIAVRRANREFVPACRVSLADSAVGWILCRSDILRGLALRLHAARLYGWKRLGQSGWLGFENALRRPRSSASRQL